MPEHQQIRNSGSTSLPSLVLLTGFMGCGKTTVGLALAELLRWEFVDLDEYIVEELLRRCDSCTDGKQFNPRPLAADSAEFRKLHDQRLPFYRRADVTIDANGKTRAAIAQEIGVRLQLASAP